MRPSTDGSQPMGTLGYGVSHDTTLGSANYRVRLQVFKHQLHIGRFAGVHEAKLAYDLALSLLRLDKSRPRNYPAGHFEYRNPLVEAKANKLLQQLLAQAGGGPATAAANLPDAGEDAGSPAASGAAAAAASEQGPGTPAVSEDDAAWQQLLQMVPQPEASEFDHSFLQELLSSSSSSCDIPTTHDGMPYRAAAGPLPAYTLASACSSLEQYQAGQAGSAETQGVPCPFGSTGAGSPSMVQQAAAATAGLLAPQQAPDASPALAAGTVQAPMLQSIASAAAEPGAALFDGSFSCADVALFGHTAACAVMSLHSAVLGLDQQQHLASAMISWVSAFRMSSSGSCSSGSAVERGVLQLVGRLVVVLMARGGQVAAAGAAGLDVFASSHGFVLSVCESLAHALLLLGSGAQQAVSPAAAQAPVSPGVLQAWLHVVQQAALGVPGVGEVVLLMARGLCCGSPAIMPPTAQSPA